MEEKKIFDKQFVHFMWDDELEGKEGFAADTIKELERMVEHGIDKVSCSEFGNDDFPFRCPGSIGQYWIFFYYDPLYEYKKAFNEGKIVQIKDHIHNNWQDVKYEHILWGENADTGEYRIKSDDEHKLVFAPNGCISLDTEGVPCILCTGTKEKCLKYALDNWCSRCVKFKTCSPDEHCRGFKERKSMRRMTNRELAKWLADNNGQVEYISSEFKCTEHSYTANDDDSVSSNVKIRGWDETEWHEPLMGEQI